jgi:hypothetical protein
VTVTVVVTVTATAIGVIAGTMSVTDGMASPGGSRPRRAVSRIFTLAGARSDRDRGDRDDRRRYDDRR